MAKWLPEKLTQEQLLSLLAGLAMAGVLAITVLLVVTKATVVELELRLAEVSLTIVPPRESAVDLFHQELAVRDLQWKGADRFEATLVAPKPGRATAALDDASVIGLGAAAAFRPDVRLRRPVRLKLEPSRRGDLTITFDPVIGVTARRLGFSADPEPGDWLCQVLPQDDLGLRLGNVELIIDTERFRDPQARLEPAAAALLFSGGTRKAELGLAPVIVPQGLTTVSVVDPQSGKVTETGKGLRLKLPEERVLITVGERLVLLDREPADPEAGTLLAPNLDVRDPALYRRTRLRNVTLHEESFLLGGQIRFPGGEKEPVGLSRGTLLRLPDRTRLRLKSLRMVDGDLELVLWGKPASLETGPTLELMAEILPSVFVWLSTHRLPLVFSVLGTLLAAVVGLLRLLGLVKKD